MIRYFPESVDHQAIVAARREKVVRACPQLTDSLIQRRAATAYKCRCSDQLTFPPSAPIRGCPVSSGGSSLNTVLGLGRWSQVPWDRKVELMMSGGHPVTAALAPGYLCHPIHLVITLCPSVEVKRFLDPTEPGNLRRKDSMGNTAFLLLVASRCIETSFIADVLRHMEKGEAEKLVREENEEGMTALHLAVLKSKKKLVKLLLLYGADVNAGAVKVQGQCFGVTPFHLSLLQYSKHARKCFCCLLAVNADPHIQVLGTVGDGSAVGFRFECQCGGCWSTPVKNLGSVLPRNAIGKNRSVSVGATLNILASFRDDSRKNSFISTLLLYRPDTDVDLADHNGMSPLGHAVMARDIDLTRRLASRSDRVDQPGTDSEGQTVDSPLELAKMLSNRDPNDFSETGDTVISDGTDNDVTKLQRLLELDDVTCPWCQYQSREPLKADNVAVPEKRIYCLLSKLSDDVKNIR